MPSRRVYNLYMRKAKSEATEFEEWVCLNLGNIKNKFRRLHVALPRAGEKAPVREQWLVLGTSYRAFRYIVSSVVCPLRPGIAMFLMISTRFHSVGHVQNHTQGILPGMDLPIRSVSSERHSYAYPPPPSCLHPKPLALLPLAPPPYTTLPRVRFSLWCVRCCVRCYP